MGQMRIGTGALVMALLLGFAVGTVRAQPGFSPAEHERVVNGARDMNASLQSQFDAMATLVTAAFVVVFAAGGVVALAVGTRWYFRLRTPSDPNHLVHSDPWVREHLARQNGGNPPAIGNDPNPEEGP
jgi:hypothetical protein